MIAANVAYFLLYFGITYDKLYFYITWVVCVLFMARTAKSHTFISNMDMHPSQIRQYDYRKRPNIAEIDNKQSL